MISCQRSQGDLLDLTIPRSNLVGGEIYQWARLSTAVCCVDQSKSYKLSTLKPGLASLKHRDRICHLENSFGIDLHEEFLLNTEVLVLLIVY